MAVVQDLALQVAQVHRVEIHDPQRSDPRRRQIQGHRRPEPPGADEQHLAAEQAPLPGAADLGEDQVAAVPPDLRLGHDEARLTHVAVSLSLSLFLSRPRDPRRPARTRRVAPRSVPRAILVAVRPR